MVEINELLRTRFDRTSLSEMDSVKLMNRIDIKYIFSIALLPEILLSITENYHVLEIENKFMSSYRTLYFDTPDFNLYLQHHNGKLNRYKIRYRNYIETDQIFFEIKFKTNKGRTLKNRITSQEISDRITESYKLYLEENTPYKPEAFIPALWVYYYRITLVNKCENERLTIDVDLRFSNAQKECAYPGLVIAELKKEKSGYSPFKKAMQNKKIEAISISKYCLGVISTNENIKTNRFKPQLKIINKICHEIK